MSGTGTAAAVHGMEPVRWVRPHLVVIAVAGCFLGVSLVTTSLMASRDLPTGGPAPTHAGVNGTTPGSMPDTHEMRTSFGVLGVQEPQLVRGMTARSLAGQTHGIQSFVPPDRQLVQVPVTLYNELDEPVRYDPAWFRLRRVPAQGDGAARRRRARPAGAPVIAASSSSLVAGQLQPHAAIEGVVSFVAPADGSSLRLLFDEPGAAPVSVLLQSTTSRYAPRAGDFARHGRVRHNHRAARRVPASQRRS
jgi:hypothetical protein